GLATLAAQVALALESVARTDDLVRRRSEARMTSLVQHSSDVVCVVSADGELSYASPSTERVLGHAVDDVLGRPLGALVHPDDASLLTRFLAQVSRQAAADPPSTELRLRHADGGWRHVEALGTNLLADATVDGIV